MSDDLIGKTPLPGWPPVKRIVREAVVLHEGWELDNRAWAVELEDGSIAVLCTNHGSIVEWTPKDIREKLEETRASADSLEALLMVMFSRGLITKNQAVRELGLRDYAELILAMNEANLLMPRLPDEEIERMADEFARIWLESPNQNHAVLERMDAMQPNADSAGFIDKQTGATK